MSELVEVGRYQRDLGAGLERLIENALDWEHLPHTHSSSFSAIAIVDHGPEGWRAETALADSRPVLIDLRLTDAGWITRTEMDGRLASEIRSEAIAVGPDRCRVDVRFLRLRSGARPRSGDRRLL